METRIQRASLFAVAIGTLLALFGMSGAAQSGNSELGTWKANLAKSKYVQGTAPKSATTKIEPAGSGVKITVDSVAADGMVRHWEYSANYDGKDTRITGNSQYGDAVARTRIDANTVKAVYKNAGKVTATQTSVVSGGGKVRTVTTTGTDAKGTAVDNVLVYDRQ